MNSEGERERLICMQCCHSFLSLFFSPTLLLERNLELDIPLTQPANNPWVLQQVPGGCGSIQQKDDYFAF